MTMTAPLHGIKVIEFAGLAPAPFAGLVFADWGASVTRIDRAGATTSEDVLCRGKRSIAIDLKTDSGRDLACKLISNADILIDPFRPGVLEKLGLGPHIFLDNGGLNERLIYSRLSGFRRTGKYKDMAGHDINYLALSGVLSMLPGDTPSSPPSFPLNIVADFAGGGMTCALGILLALHARNSSAKGQVVEVDMVSGTRYLASFPLIHAMTPTSPMFGTQGARGTGILDGGAPFYAVYTCKDGLHMSVGCIEARFFEIFLHNLLRNLPREFLDAERGWMPDSKTRLDKNQWPRLWSFLQKAFKTKTRDEWTVLFDGTDSCVVPVLLPNEAAEAASPVPKPHPVLSKTSSKLPSKAIAILKPGEHTHEILEELTSSDEEKRYLIQSGALGTYGHAKL